MRLDDPIALPLDRDDQNRINVRDPEIVEHVDFETAAIYLDCTHSDNLVIVAMDPMAEDDDATRLWLGMEAQSSLRADCGTVLAASPEELAPGDRVALLPFNGKSFRSIRSGEFGHVGRVLMIGVDSEDDDTLVQIPWHETVVMKICDGFRPVKDWCLCRRAPLKKSMGSLYLPDVAVFRDQTLVVVACGDLAVEHGIVVGSSYYYRAAALVVDLPGLERYLLEADPADYVLIRAGNLYARKFE